MPDTALAEVAASESRHAEPVGHSRRRPLRVAFFGELGSGNTGNDGSFEVVLEWVRRGAPDAEIFAICTAPEAVTARFGIPAEPREPPRADSSRFRALRVLARFGRRLSVPLWLFRVLKDTDWVIIPGAGVLESSWYRPWMLPFDLYSLTLSAWARGTRVALVSVGVDRARSRLSRWLLARVARRADHLSVRDQHSLSALGALGVDASPDQVNPDLAFGLMPPPEQIPHPRSVGVGLVNFFDWRGSSEQRTTNGARYEAAMVSFVEWLLDEGYSVRLLTGDIWDDPYLGRILKTLRGRRPDLSPDRLVGEPARDLHQLMSQMGEVEVMVAARFHNIVVSLKLGKPILALSYAPKALGALEWFGLSSFAHRIEAIDLPKLEEEFDDLYRRRAEIGADLRRRLPFIEAQIQGQRQRLLAELLSSPPAPRLRRRLPAVTRP